MSASNRNNRIIVIDDNPAIHTDMRKILCPAVCASAANLAALEAELLGDEGVTPRKTTTVSFELDSAHQGREGLALVTQAQVDQRPYAMAFVDMRMPPGWDGLETTLELWKVAPDLQIVICTAYSDYSWDELLARIGDTDRLVILKKPFDTVEVLQLANALTTKWTLQQESRAEAAELEARVLTRTTELEATNTALQAEIGRRAVIEADLVRARDAAEAAARAKSVFLANMSHEIRTPMNGVIGMANLLLSSPLNAEQHDLTNTLCRSGEALLAIINDILDFSKVEAGCVTFETIDFDLAEELASALDLQSDAANRKNLELILDLDPAVPRLVQGDPIRLRQVLINLVGNAIKFTTTGEVVARVRPEPDTDDGRVSLRFEISDTGIGIPPEVLPNLFQPFVQADASTTRRFGGTGLGLAICKRLIELAGGRIGVESVAGSGSTFWFTAQFGHSVVPTEAPPPPSPFASLAGCRILAVDDNATNRKLIGHLLTSWQISHAEVDSAAAALNALREAAHDGAPYQMVLLDHHMPDTDGLQLAAQIRAAPLFGRPQLALLTSRGESLTAEERRAHGLAFCELKPFHPDRLRASLARALSAGSTGDEPARAAPAASASAKAPVEHSPRILIAEDNRVNQKVAFLQLRNLGYEADVVGNGREAINALAQRRYALVLMDAQMPELDGFEATRLIRRAQSLGDPSVPAHLPIIAMTANAMSGDREACIASGMDDYISKPVNIDNLREILTRHLVPVEAADLPS